MLIRRWVWALLLAGCAAKGTKTTPPTPVSEAEEESADPHLWAVADAVDPGPQRPLFDALPAWLRGRVGATPDREVAVKEIREALLAWDKMRPTGSEGFMMSLMSLGRGLVLAEQAVADGVDDPELLLALSKAYSILSNPAFSDENGLFQQLLQFSAMVATQAKKPGEEGVDVAALMTALRTVFTRAPLLHRRTSAELLRRHGDHPEVPKVLGRLADDARKSERFHEALKLRQMSLERMGKAATGGDWLDLADTCFKALDPACGDEALAKGKALGSDKPEDRKAVAEFTKRVDLTAEVGARSRQVRTLTEDPRVRDPQHTDLVPALERGHQLILLGHYADARAQYEALRAAHPNDARPYAGLAKATVSQAANLTEGARWIDAGRGLANRDRDFFEVALGVFGAKLVTEVMPAVMKPDAPLNAVQMLTPMLDDMKEYATGLQTFDPARGAVMLELEAVLRTALPRIDRKEDTVAKLGALELVARTKVLVDRFPESADVRRMAHLAALMAEDRALALALVRAPLAGKLAGDAELQRSRVQTWLDVTILWDAAEEVPGVLAAARALPKQDGDWHRDSLEALALALQARTAKDREAVIEAVKLYDEVALRDEASAEAKVAAVCSSAALLASFGEAEAAKQRYELILSKEPKAMAALLNIAALFTTHGVHEPKLTEIFEVAAKEAENVTMRLQAHAWRYTQAKGGLGDVEVSRQGFIEAFNKARSSEIRGNLSAGGKMGAYSSGDWNLSLQYQPTVGFTIINQMKTTTVLLLPSPDTEELIAAADAAHKKAGKTKPVKPAVPVKPVKPAK
jgi:tetratricopeptide (TPR) repeat protein